MSEVFNIAFTVFTLFTGISIGVIAFLITVLIIYKGINYILERENK